jgi:3-hydroxyisobutyrate dehydrogenase
MTAAPTIGFVGVGNMGFAMARHALQQGVAVVAFDPSSDARDRIAAAGATTVDDPASVATRCAEISVVVNTDQQVRDAILGAGGVLQGAAPGTVVAIHSTIHVETLEAVAAAAADVGVTVVDAAVTGGVEAAAAGRLAVLLGGDLEAIERLRPGLSSYASLVVRVGDLGAGMAAKISVMVISFGKLAAAYEGLLLADAAGVGVDELARIVAHSEQVSGIHDFFLHERARRFAPDYEGALLAIARHESPKSQKDLHAALELAAHVGVSLPVAAAAHDEMPAAWGV